jgi:hypothetical protein
MSVTTSVKRYISSFSPDAGQSRNSAASSPSFSSSFVTAGRFWLAANAIWATLVLVAAATVAMRLPVAKSWPFIAFAVFLSAVFALRELWRGVVSAIARPMADTRDARGAASSSPPGGQGNWRGVARDAQGAASSSPPGRISLKTLLILLLGLASTGFLLWPCLTRGAFVSVTGDTFMYCAHGQYLVDHPRGFAFGLAPVDQYAMTQSETRFGTASVLGFFSVLSHSSTAAVLPIYIFIVLANIFSGFVLLSRRFGCNRLFSLAAGLYAVIGGWAPNALNIGGLDNLLFLSLFPFLVVRLALYRFGQKTWSTSLGLAVLAASVFYAYPDGVAIAGVMFLPFFCESLWFGMYRRGGAWRGYVISACLVVVLISPYARESIFFLLDEISIGMSKGAAGTFPGLFSPSFLPAMFALGPEYGTIMYLPHHLVLPIIMLAFIVFGGAAWVRRRKSLIFTFLILIIMGIWQGSFVQFDYGLYKILFIGSLIWIPALFRGGTALTNLASESTRPFAVALGTIVFFSGGLAQRMEEHAKIPHRQVIPIKWYSELANLQHKVGNRPVLLVCDNTFSQDYVFDQEWAVFFLRHVNLKVPKFFGYLGAKLYEPLMQRAKSTGEPAAFVLVNKRMEGAVWSNQRFSLLELGSKPILIGVQAANGLEHVNGKPFVWLGNNPTRLLIVSKTAQTANFSAEGCVTGLRRPEDRDRQIRISTDGNLWQADVSGDLSLQVPLKPGLNFLNIACQDASAVSEQPSGDPKALPIGLWDYRISTM